MHPALALAISYTAGSLPFAWLAGKAAGVDLRQQGSGNLGATNVFRVLGWKVGLAVFLADAMKGALPVLLLPRHIDSPADPTLWAIACGVAAIMGHVRPVFLRFRKGGQGVATAAGVFFENFIALGTPGTVLSAGTIPLSNIAVGIEVAGAFLLLFTEFSDQALLVRGE